MTDVERLSKASGLTQEELLLLSCAAGNDYVKLDGIGINTAWKAIAGSARISGVTATLQAKCEALVPAVSVRLTVFNL